MFISQAYVFDSPLVELDKLFKRHSNYDCCCGDSMVA